MIPEIVVRKIWWYEWKMKQREICDEYRERLIPDLSGRVEVLIKWGEKLKCKKGIVNIICTYNCRKLGDELTFFENFVYSKRLEIVGELSTNYVYSKKID